MSRDDLRSYIVDQLRECYAARVIRRGTNTRLVTPPEISFFVNNEVRGYTRIVSVNPSFAIDFKDTSDPEADFEALSEWLINRAFFWEVSET